MLPGSNHRKRRGRVGKARDRARRSRPGGSGQRRHDDLRIEQLGADLPGQAVGDHAGQGGTAQARGLARAGARVVLTAAREREEIEATAREIAREMGTVSRCRCWPTSPRALTMEAPAAAPDDMEAR